mmetsp:Transcript_100131/g.158440  ORF Transcript_100131/g.158440 Transcript_100131/m.158440 type:complete len:94 (+) Transcript_100131:142-423(+)
MCTANGGIDGSHQSKKSDSKQSRRQCKFVQKLDDRYETVTLELAWTVGPSSGGGGGMCLQPFSMSSGKIVMLGMSIPPFLTPAISRLFKLKIA